MESKHNDNGHLTGGGEALDFLMPLTTRSGNVDTRKCIMWMPEKEAWLDAGNLQIRSGEVIMLVMDLGIMGQNPPAGWSLFQGICKTVEKHEASTNLEGPPWPQLH